MLRLDYLQKNTMGKGAVRNDPCPCGSGRKFKKCCLQKPAALPSYPSPPPEVVEYARRHMREEAERRRKFGNIRPVVTTVHQGHRFVAVGSRVYFDKEWRTFTDFLLFYVRDVMGREWWETESAKRDHERHPIMRWHDHFIEAQKNATRHDDGLLSSVPDGTVSALLLLAYDLYGLRDHAKLQDEVVQRLRHRNQFQGARYELFVAATFIRAGLEFAFEDETDTSTKHAEFVATDPESGLVMAVEAKARQRTMKAPFEMASIRPGVKQLLDSASDKQPAHPLIVFLELNLPPEPAQQVPGWVPHVNGVLQEIAAERENHSPFAAVLFTNRPHLYGEPGEPDPSKHYYAAWPNGSAVPDALIDRLGEAATQYGNVPSKFPAEFSTTPTE